MVTTSDENLDRFVTAYRDQFSYAYDNEIILNWYPKRIMSLCSPGDSLLELGIGHGYTTTLFARHFVRHVVIDGSAAVIEQFQRESPDCTAAIVQAYFEDFETDERFDTVVMGFVLEHVEDPLQVLRHYLKFLRPGGRCFIAVPNGESLHRQIGYKAGLLDNMMNLGTGDLELGHRRLYSVSTLRNAVNESGYRTVREEGIFLKPFTTAQMVSLRLSEPVHTALCEIGIHHPEMCAALLFEAVAARS